MGFVANSGKAIVGFSQRFSAQVLRGEPGKRTPQICVIYLR